MTKEFAEMIKNQALNAIMSYSMIMASEDFALCDEKERKVLHRRLGMLIGETQLLLDETIYKNFPELDDL